jgi:import inner membrane translocase subunit TIM23
LTDADLALVYNAINSTIDATRGKHDTFGSMAAGAVTGALYKSTGESARFASGGRSNRRCLRPSHLTAGVKPALAAATMISGGAGIWSYVKRRI